MQSTSVSGWRGWGVGWASGVGAGLVLSGACDVERRAADHCAQLDGDADCERRHPDGSRPYCVRGTCEMENLDGCYATRPSDDACYSPCGGGLSLPDDPECEGLADGSSSVGSVSATESATEPSGPTTEPTAGSMSASGSETEDASSTTTTTGCGGSIECIDPATPICVDTACVPCSTDEQCEARDPAMPACHEDGRCVVCTPTNATACDGTMPVCDAGASACVGCTFHEQCPASACRIELGGCFDEAEVYDVGGGQTYATISAAVAELGEGGEAVLRVHAGASYDEAVVIGGAGTAYALLADGDVVPQWVNTGGGESTLRVEDDAEVYVQSMRLTANTGSDSPGITADGASLYLDRSSVVGNTGGGILLTGGAEGHLRNCFVGGFSDVVAMTVDNASADIVYTTLGGQFDAPALACISPDGVTVRNSIVVSRAAATDLSCSGAAISYSATEAAVPGMGNVAVGSFDMADATAWFANYNGGNFGLTAAGAVTFGDVALWTVGDPTVDIDGNARPTEDATPDVAGADLP